MADSEWIDELSQWLELQGIPFEKTVEELEGQILPLIYFPTKNIKLLLFDIYDWEQKPLSESYGTKLSQLAATTGNKYICLWQDLWYTKQALLKARIRSVLGFFTRLHARHCVVSRIDKPLMESFFNTHHLQGSTQAKLKYGLFLKKQYIQKYLGENFPTHENALIAVASFSGARTMKWGDRQDFRSYELLRFASLQGYVVVGGMDKLMKAFMHENQPDDIMSYADKDWSDGRSYHVLGFKQVVDFEIATYYWVNSKTYERYPENRILQQYSLEELKSQGWIRIVNSGSLKYIKTLCKE
ncbi:hypothetical protein GOQ04_01170 [Emticicia sp. ODNR4P]|nr:hypothetical protein [Emticicia sp. ODNR4P]